MPSTVIGTIAYDEKRRHLVIEFVTNRRRYAYIDVPPEVHQALLRSSSKGEYFNTQIRPNYDCELVFDPNWGARRSA